MTEKNGFPSSGSRELRVADTLSHCIPRKLLLVHKGIRLVAPGLIDRTGGRREHWKRMRKMKERGRGDAKGK